MKKYNFILFLTLILLSPQAQARDRDRIDNADRLAQVYSATGNTSSASPATFQSRLDAILSTTPSTTERAHVAAEDAQIRQQANDLAQQEKELEEKRSKELTPDRYDPQKSSDQFRVKDSNVAENAKVNNTEKAYQQERADIQKEFDERISKLAERKTAQSSDAAASKANGAGLPPSLANNPFYNKTTAELDEENYDAMKPILISRIMAHDQDISAEQAANYVNSATSKEDLILVLMKEGGQSYGQASSTVE